MTTFMGRQSDHPIEQIILERWSPRAYTGETIPQDVLLSVFEAARWAPSSYNSQPWRIAYGLRGTEAFNRILATLNDANQSWAQAASVLAVIASKTTMAPFGKEMPSYSHSFDAGAAWQNIGLQATALGWHVHGMSGFDVDRAARDLNLPEGHRIEAAFAIGRQGDKSALPERWQALEDPNSRNPQESFAFEGGFGQP